MKMREGRGRRKGREWRKILKGGKEEEGRKEGKEGIVSKGRG